MAHNSAEAKRQMLAECRTHYRSDRTVLMKIAEFARQYRCDEVIFWYTKHGFLHQLINGALRGDDVMAAYTFRYCVID